jgi:hypothetical protein
MKYVEKIAGSDEYLMVWLYLRPFAKGSTHCIGNLWRSEDISAFEYLKKKLLACILYVVHKLSFIDHTKTPFSQIFCKVVCHLLQIRL